MGNCKDCHKWDEDDGTCRLPDWIDGDDKLAGDSMAVCAMAADDQGLDVWLRTGPMFGCVQFQSRNPRKLS